MDRAELVSRILDGFKDPDARLSELLSEGWRIPPSIYMGGNHYVFLSREQYELFAALAECLIKDNRRESDFTIEEWSKTVRRIVGPILYHYAKSNTELDIDTITVEVDHRVRAETDGTECEYAFGCHFVDLLDLEPFTIGPVRFESRHAWVSRHQERGTISDISRRRLEKAWQGKSLRKRKWSRDYQTEKSALDITKNSGSICSVSVRPMGNEMGLQKALTAARLATTVVALAWQTPSKALNAINLTYDRLPHDRNFFASTPGGFCGGATEASYLPGGVSLKLEDWKETVPQFEVMFECVGETIYAVTRSSRDIRRSHVVRSLHLSLLWFHAACRESIDTMAVARFWFSLDALTKGYAKATGCRTISVRDLVRAKIEPDRESEKRLVEDLDRIYDIRNSMSHGSDNSNELGHDCSVLRWCSEYFARRCLISSMEDLRPAIQSADPYS